MKEAGGMLMVAQDQGLRTNNITSQVDKQIISPLYRLCGEREERISHGFDKCKTLAQKQHRLWRDGRVGVVAH